MSLQNRVTPWGALEATSARGAWMGNRGILVDAHRHVLRPWQNIHWITCRLHYKDVHRTVFSPHSWSELFFLDEATAFAAGHRPCAFCRRPRFNAFKTAWASATGGTAAEALRVNEVDRQLHAERIRRGGGKLTYLAPFGTLPEGAFIALGGDAWLLWHGTLWRWTHWGYDHPRVLPSAAAEAVVLTPRSLIACLRAGLIPQVHPSADGGGAEGWRPLS